MHEPKVCQFKKLLQNEVSVLFCVAPVTCPDVSLSDCLSGQQHPGVTLSCLRIEKSDGSQVSGINWLLCPPPPTHTHTPHPHTLSPFLSLWFCISVCSLFVVLTQFFQALVTHC